MILSNLHPQGIAGGPVQEPGEFEGGLAWDDDPVIPLRIDPFGGQRAKGQPMTIRGHTAHVVASYLQTDSVQKVPDILSGHRKSNIINELLQNLLGDGKLQDDLWLLEFGKLICRQRRQGETAASTADDRSFSLLRDIDSGTGRQ